MGASPLGGMPSGCAASKSIRDQFVFPMISVVSGIRNALDLLDLSVLPTAIRVGLRRRIRFGFLTALLGVVRQFVVPDMKRISFCLSIPKMPSGESAFEISDIQEERNREPGPSKAQNIPM